MRRHVLAGAVATAVVAVTMTATGANAAGEVFDNGAGGERYVALGDSAAAGPVITPQRTGVPCLRSERNFPTDTASELGVRSFTDVTCSSATIDNFTTPQESEPPQFDALRADTTLVTMGPIGANDVGLVSTAAGCVALPGCKERDGQTVHAKIEAIRAELAAALNTIKQRSPQAAIVVVGYGRYLPAGGCYPTQPITSSDGDYVQGLIDHTNQVLSDAARAAGATFADLRTTPGALDHTACAPAGQRWLEGLVPLSGDGAIPFHPTALGMNAFSGTVAQAARTAKAQQDKARQDAAKAQLAAAAKKVRGQAACRGSKVRFRVLTGRAPVTRADFRVSKKIIGSDRAAPFTFFASKKSVQKRAGTFTAKVRLTVPDAASTITVKIKRPKCSRKR